MTAISAWIFILSFLGMLFAASFNAPRWVHRLFGWSGLIALSVIAYGITVWMWNVMP